MRKSDRPTKKEFEKRLAQKWREALESCLGPAPTQLTHLLKDADRKTTDQNLKAGMAFALRILGTDHLKKKNIKTEEQFAKACEELRVWKEKMPTAIRKATRDLAKALPRRGGPGRQPILNSDEAAKACDHIAMFIRQNHTLKEALQKMAQSSESLLGKKVGARTLQKFWDKRDQLR
jgi:hypothetical protein